MGKAVAVSKGSSGNCPRGSIACNDCLLGASSVCLLQVGFTDPRVLERSEMEVKDPELCKLLGAARFFSITYR